MQAAKTGDFKPFDASKWRIGIVVAQFNKHITNELVEGALKRATDYKIEPANIDTVSVAGCIEIPLVLQSMAKSGKYNTLLAIGCVIRGATPHFEYVCKFVSEGVLRVQLDFNMPIGFGILTCDNEQQALERTNLGGEFLDAALQQAHTIQDLHS